MDVSETLRDLFDEEVEEVVVVVGLGAEEEEEVEEFLLGLVAPLIEIDDELELELELDFTAGPDESFAQAFSSSLRNPLVTL